MYSLILYSLYCLVFPKLGHFIAADQYTTLVWKNKDQFLEGGWRRDGFSGVYGYDKPSYFRPRDGLDLSPLDAGSSEDIWGGTVWMDRFWFVLDKDHPSLCGFTEANLTMKMYLTRVSNVHIHNCFNQTNNRMCRATESNGLQWTTQTFPLTEFEKEKNIKIIGDFQSSIDYQPILLDEVTLTHNGQCDPLDPPTTTTESSDNCNESCEYRAIDCHNYYSCRDYSYKTYLTCPLSLGLAFNPNIGLCDWMENVEGCQPQKCECEYRPSLSNCSQFFFCSNSCQEETCELRNCPHGLVWSVQGHGNGESVQQCTVPGNATCASP